MANVDITGQPIKTTEQAIHYNARIQYATDSLIGRVVELHSDDYFRLQIDNINWRLMRNLDRRKSPRIGILYDNGRIVQSLYLQGYSDRMAIFGKITTGLGLLPTQFYYVNRLEFVSGR